MDRKQSEAVYKEFDSVNHALLLKKMTRFVAQTNNRQSGTDVGEHQSLFSLSLCNSPSASPTSLSSELEE